MTETPERIRFQPGAVVTIPGALEVAPREQIAGVLARHRSGDWGDVDREDAAANARALTHGERILSAYEVNGQKL